MSYTVLELIDQVCGELGLSQPASVIGNTNNITVQMLALANRFGKDLVRDYEWQRLVKAYVFQTSEAVTEPDATITTGSATITSIGSLKWAQLSIGDVISGTGIPSYAEIVALPTLGEATMNMLATTSTSAASLTFAKQDYSLPSDFDRMISDTNWDRTNHWRNLGTKTSQEWQWLQGGVISIGPRERYRIYNNKLRIFAALTSVYSFAFEYVSNAWVIATGGTAGTKTAFTVDSDTCVFPDDLMLAGLKYMYLKAKKLDFTVELAELGRTLSYCKAQDVPVPSMSLSPKQLPELVGPWSVQDGNWPT